MKHLFCFAVAVSLFASVSLGNHAVAGEADKAKPQSSVSDDADHYSPPLGGESCSTPVPVS
jgi:hypothetical protein